MIYTTRVPTETPNDGISLYRSVLTPCIKTAKQVVPLWSQGVNTITGLKAFVHLCYEIK